MSVRTSIIAALIPLLAACYVVDEPSSPYDVRSEGQGVTSRPDAPTPPQAQDQAQAQSRETDDPKPEPLWPRRFVSGETSFATYEPQVDSWKNDKLEARVAVEVFEPGAATPKYGIVWFEAPTRTDRQRRVVTLGDVRVVRAHFPTAKDREASYVDALRGAELAESKTVALERLEQQIAYGANHEPVPSQPVKNDPPAILVSDRPTVLVLVDGTPHYRDDGGVQRVVNTRALLVSHGASFYVWVGDRWFRASSVDGTYTEARDVPPALDAAKNRLAATAAVDLFSDATDRVRQGVKVTVATKPTELIETRGAPIHERIQGTTLSYVVNTDSDVLRDEATGQTYVLLSGRWFRGPSMNGPWAFVSGRDLPATMRDIPRGHREARVLASIPTTPEAEEAAIAASVPQTATVDRGEARLAVAYDGQPSFQPVEGASAPLTYAVNTATPVVGTADGMYYAVENGVWFVSASPRGPWTVATSIPDVIYSIPVSSPIHHVTYVRIYGYSPEYAYVGYTPGYLGAYYAYGTVVFGTGYLYPPWIGSVWYGRPRYWRPAWGWRPTFVAGGNVYRRWAPSVVHAPPAHVATAPRVFAPGARVPASPSVGPRGPRGMTPASPSVAPPASPRVVAPSSPSFAPGARAPVQPRIVAPSSPSFAPGARAPVQPRIVAPSSPSFAPRVAPPSGGAGVIRAAPGGAARSAPPSFAPSAPRFPAGSAGAARSRGGTRGGGR